MLISVFLKIIKWWKLINSNLTISYFCNKNCSCASSINRMESNFSLFSFFFFTWEVICLLILYDTCVHEKVPSSFFLFFKWYLKGNRVITILLFFDSNVCREFSKTRAFSFDLVELLWWEAVVLSIQAVTGFFKILVNYRGTVEISKHSYSFICCMVQHFPLVGSCQLCWLCPSFLPTTIWLKMPLYLNFPVKVESCDTILSYDKFY